jgi:UDP-N-acetylglucosamine acyltransferase
MNIHPTAVIDRKAKIDSSVQVGPYTVIEEGVSIGADTEIGPNAYITGRTTIGKGNRIGPFTVIGGPPQDIHYNNEPTELVIGDNNLFREYVSIHRGTPGGRGITTIGDNNLLMAYVHIAHDCMVGNHVIMANAATLGGHVEVDDRANLGGVVAVHQFTKIGTYAYIGGMSGVSKDVPPYIIMSGIRNQMRVTGINKVGLKRSGFDNDTIRKMNRAFQLIFRTPDLLLQDALDQTLEEMPDCKPVIKLVDFFRTSKRSVVRAFGDEG